MNFFIRYAIAVERQLSEKESNIGDIVVDWVAIAQEETTVQQDDTSNKTTTLNPTTPADFGLVDMVPDVKVPNRRVDRRSSIPERYMASYESYKTSEDYDAKEKFNPGRNRRQDNYDQEGATEGRHKKVRSRGKKRDYSEPEYCNEQTFNDEWDYV